VSPKELRVGEHGNGKSDVNDGGKNLYDDDPKDRTWKKTAGKAIEREHHFRKRVASPNDRKLSDGGPTAPSSPLTSLAVMSAPAGYSRVSSNRLTMTLR
jgi:hypothetical protein